MNWIGLNSPVCRNSLAFSREGGETDRIVTSFILISIQNVILILLLYWNILVFHFCFFFSTFSTLTCQLLFSRPKNGDQVGLNKMSPSHHVPSGTSTMTPVWPPAVADEANAQFVNVCNWTNSMMSNVMSRMRTTNTFFNLTDSNSLYEYLNNKLDLLDNRHRCSGSNSNSDETNRLKPSSADSNRTRVRRGSDCDRRPSEHNSEVRLYGIMLIPCLFLCFCVRFWRQNILRLYTYFRWFIRSQTNATKTSHFPMHFMAAFSNCKFHRDFLNSAHHQIMWRTVYKWLRIRDLQNFLKLSVYVYINRKKKRGRIRSVSFQDRESLVKILFLWRKRKGRKSDS